MLIQEGTPYMKILSFLSEVSLVFSVSPYLNIFCIISEKPNYTENDVGKESEKGENSN